MEKIIRYCPDDGKRLNVVLLPNEEPYNFDDIGGSFTVRGNAYSFTTGEKLYRIRLECPETVSEGLFKKKKVSHKRLNYRDDITKEDAKVQFDMI